MENASDLITSENYYKRLVNSVEDTLRNSGYKNISSRIIQKRDAHGEYNDSCHEAQVEADGMKVNISMMTPFGQLLSLRGKKPLTTALKITLRGIARANQFEFEDFTKDGE